MAKQTEDDDFGMDDFGGDHPDAGRSEKSGGGLASRLPAPIAGLFGTVRDFFENIGLALSSAWNNPSRPWMPLAMLGGVILVLLMLLIIIVGSALSGAKPDGIKPGQPAAQVAPSEKTAEAQTSVEGPGSRIQGDLGLRDSFLGNAILPDEPGFMRMGEIHYQRVPQAFWSQADIQPGWQNLGTLYRQLLREKNRDDFYRMMGEVPPKKDGY